MDLTPSNPWAFLFTVSSSWHPRGSWIPTHVNQGFNMTLGLYLFYSLCILAGIGVENREFVQQNYSVFPSLSIIDKQIEIIRKEFSMLKFYICLKKKFKAWIRARILLLINVWNVMMSSLSDSWKMHLPIHLSFTELRSVRVEG